MSSYPSNASDGTASGPRSTPDAEDLGRYSGDGGYLDAEERAVGPNETPHDDGAQLPRLPDEGEPRDRKIPRDIWVLIAAAFAIAIGFGLIAPVLPQFAEMFSVSVSATTVVVSAFAAFRLLWATPAGSLVQRFGERPIYMAGVSIVALSSAATAFAQNYWQLLVFRSLGGIGSVMFTVAAVGLIVKLSPPHIRGKISAVYGATFLIGNIAGPVLGGFLASAGMRVPFLVYAATLLVAVVVVGTLLPKTGTGSGASSALPPMTFREAWRDPAYRAALSTGIANGWANFGVRISIVPLFVAAAISSDTRAAGIVMAAFAVGNAAVLPFSSRFADTVGRRPLIIAGAAIAGVFTILIGLSTSFVVLLVFSMLAGLGAGTLNPGQQAALADVVGSGRTAGRVISTYQMVQDVGSIVGPILAGVIVDYLGFDWAFALTGAVVLVAAIPWLRTDETLHRGSR